MSAGPGVSAAMGRSDRTLGDYALGGGSTQPCWVIVTDVNGDGKPDLILTDASANSLRILLDLNGGARAWPLR